MEKYTTFDAIRSSDIESFSGLDKEISLAPIPATEILPIEISRFGITYPDKNYRIKRNPSPCFIVEYIASGVGYIEINGKKHRLEKNDVYIVHPGDHCEYYADRITPYKKYWINFRSSFFFDFIKNYGIEERVIHGIDISGYFEQIFELEKISSRCDDLYLPISKILFSMMIDIASYKKQMISDGEVGLAAQVKNYLEYGFNEDVTMDTLEKVFYRSKSQITKSFKAAYNTTPYSYLIDIRIELAKNLLKTTKTPIKEIAEYFRFSSEYHFSGSFKKRVGVSPRDYRKSCND
jgi:AraC-like DNA-binding protein